MKIVNHIIWILIFGIGNAVLAKLGNIEITSWVIALQIFCGIMGAILGGYISPPPKGKR